MVPAQSQTNRFSTEESSQPWLDSSERCGRIPPVEVGAVADSGGGGPERPLVSVLIPTFNRPELLMRAISSVMAQSVTDLEIVVRDDGGGGNVEEMLSMLDDSRVRYSRNAVNVGDAETNIGLYRDARGKYLAHLDDDDEWDTEFLERMLMPLESFGDLNLAFCNHLVIDIVGNPQWARTFISERRWGREGLQRGVQYNGRHLAAVLRAIPTGHAAVIRRSALDLDLLDPGIARAWDMYIASLAVRSNGRCWFDPERLSFYRVHGGQMSDVIAPVPFSESKYAGLVYCLVRLIEDDTFVSERLDLRGRLSKQYGNWALGLLTVGQSSDAVHRAHQALGTRLTLRAIAIWALAKMAQLSQLPVGRIVVQGEKLRRQVGASSGGRLHTDRRHWRARSYGAKRRWLVRLFCLGR